MILLTMGRPEHQDDKAAPHCRKRAGSEAESSNEETKRARHEQAMTAAMPPSVFPIIWSFLLNSKRSYFDPEETTGCVDYKSIASFMLVSRGTKAAFDECNGWQLCLEALDRDFYVQQEFLWRYERKFEELAKLEERNEESIQQCHSLLEHESRGNTIGCGQKRAPSKGESSSRNEQRRI